MYFKTGLAASGLALFTVTAQAQDEHVQALELKLQQRDKAIIELLERVEALEQRVGVRRPTLDQTELPAQDPAPAAETDLAQAPGAVVVEEGAAERALERSLTRAGVLLLPQGVLEVEPGFTYRRREDTSPGFVMENSELFASEIERNITDLRIGLALRLGLPWDSQLEFVLPYRAIEVETVTNINFVATQTTRQSDDGMGDISVGFAKTLLRENLWRPDVVGRLTWDTDTGEIGGFNELRGSLSTIKRQDPVTFIGGLSYEYTFENDQIKPGSAISANFGSFIALSPETSIRFIFTGSYQDESELSGDRIDGSDRTIASFLIAGATLIAPGTLLNFTLGIGLTADADDLTLTLSLPVRIDERFF